MFFFSASKSNWASLCIIGEYLLTFDSIKLDLSSANPKATFWQKQLYYLHILYINK